MDINTVIDTIMDLDWYQCYKCNYKCKEPSEINQHISTAHTI
jgi:hypothetical protein